MDLRAQQINLDTSAYRQWKSMLWNRNYKVPTITDSEESQLEGEDLHRALKEDPSNPRKSSLQKSRQAFSKLANVSFQAGFRRSMIDFQRIRLLTPNRRGLRHAAAIDTATDLSILEFKRGVNDPALHWFEHSTGRMRIDHTRREACPVEQACFLDCFANLKEFYYVVEVAHHAQRLGYKLQSSKDAASAPFELKRFYDMKNEYIQLCPPAYLQFLPKDLREHGALPLEAIDIGGARECLIKVMEFYKGLRGNDIFKNSLEDRKEVKFGILFAYKIEE
ncbi:hypothetical protein UCDDA912_g07283 [Diaporthe ampelina]|uniref:Uncharacterized protein n=1 Tax=Diaporthe ampelina TaxID=1214573 RepID=A0A0G2FDT4_9PEZI|nr:hypothetical protein UCDDA912_g07283 [Diaporthe ampelina]